MTIGDGSLDGVRKTGTNVKNTVSYPFLAPHRDRPDGVIYESFRDAAVALDLLESNEEYDNNMNEAFEFTATSGDQLIGLFVSMLLMCEIPSPRLLYDSNKLQLREHLDNIDPPPDNVPDEIQTMNDVRVLLEIRTRLIVSGKDLHDFNLPLLPGPDDMPLTQSQAHDDIEIHTPSNVDNLNDEQRAFYDRVMEKTFNVQHIDHGLFFLDGPGGTGKTYTLNTLITELERCDKKVVVVASSGIAALSFKGDATAHSTLKIPVPCTDLSTCSIFPNTPHYKLIKTADVLIWDEAPSMAINVYNCVNRTFKDVRDDHRHFGGMIVILSGDFRQTLPIEKYANRDKIVKITINRLSYWSHFEKFALRSNMRVVEGHAEWCDFLLKVGEGTAPTVAVNNGSNTNIRNGVSCTGTVHGKIILPQEVQKVDTIGGMVSAVYGSPINGNLFHDQAILAPKNVDVDKINSIIMNQFQAEEQTYTSIDSCEDGNQSSYPLEFLNSLKINDLPPHKMKLKVGSIVMCIRNVNKAEGLMNGTRVKILYLHAHMIHGEIVTEGNFKGRPVIIPRVKLQPNDTTLPFTFQRLQLPVRPAFEMTINKSQCQTLQMVGIYIQNGTDIFSHGQLYVALSRASQGPSGIVVFRREITNVVYTAVFR